MVNYENLRLKKFMNGLETYLNYYWLEKHLFEHVSESFQKHGHLTPEEFFAIVIWKRNASKTNVRIGINESGKTIKALTSEIYKADTPQRKLAVLTSINGIGISIASAILTVCYPDDFTVIDYRAKNSIENIFNEEIEGNPSASADAYFEYLEICKRLACESKLSLRDFDRALWAYDFYEGLDGLRAFVSNRKNTKK